MQAGANLPAVGGFNQIVVLDAVRRAPDGISRVELAAQTGLSAQTIGNVSRRLLSAGLIVEAGTIIAGVGKPRTILRLEPRGRYAVGVHVDPTVVTVVLLDLAGGVVAHRTIPTPDSRRVASTLGRISDVVDEVLATAGVDRERMLGVGIAAPGPVDLDSGTVIDPPLLEGWRHVPVRDELARRLGMPALLEKDVTAAAVAETWMGAATEHGNLVFFYYGTGAGVGLVVQNEVIRGVSSNAGDVGNLVVAGGKAGGHRLRLGDAIIPRLLVADAIDRGVIAERGDRATIAGVRERFAALAAAERAGDAGAVALLDGVADDIATALVTIVNLLDVERVVFGGPFFAPVADALLERIPSRVGVASGLVAPHPVTFVASTIGDDVAAVGAACLVLDHAFSPRPAGLLIKR